MDKLHAFYLDTPMKEAVKAFMIDTLKEKGIRDDYIVMVGGAPLNEEFARVIGATAYCRDAGTAVEVAKKLIAEKRAA